MSTPKKKPLQKKSTETDGLPSFEDAVVHIRIDDGEEWSYLDGPLPKDFGIKSMPANRKKRKPSK